MSIVDSRNKSDSLAELESSEATERSYVELLGREIRIVEKGLDPDEVVAFLQTTIGSSEDVFQRLEQFSALQAAAKTMEESIKQARRLAEYAKKQAETEAQQKKAQTTEEAERQATVIIDQARESCVSFVDSTHVALLEAIKEALGQARETVSRNLTRIHKDIEDAAKSHLAQWVTDVRQSKEQPAGVTPGPTDASPDGEVAEEMDAEGGEASKTAAPGLMKGELVEAADGLYSGSVRVIIPRSVKETWMQQFLDRISQAPGVKIQGESERDEERIEVTLSLEKPVELLPLLQELPNVRKVMEAWNSGGPSEERGSGEVALILQFA